MQIIEFVEFKERLERSHALAVARSEQSLIQIRRSVPRGHMDVQSALKDACQSLNATSLLTQHSGLPRLEQLRFNEDLSTRPTWLHPHRGPVTGSLLGWWEQQASTSDTGTFIVFSPSTLRDQIGAIDVHQDAGAGMQVSKKHETDDRDGADHTPQSHKFSFLMYNPIV